MLTPEQRATVSAMPPGALARMRGGQMFLGTFLGCDNVR